jgi:predicted nucleotidyltransferase
MLPSHQLSPILAALTAVAPVHGLWVFGSVAAGRAGPSSDLDLAVLFGAQPDGLELMGAVTAIEQIVGRDVDVVDLERTSPIVAMQVLRHGHALFEGDRRHVVQFLARLPGRYEDLKRVRREAEERLLGPISHG